MESLRLNGARVAKAPQQFLNHTHSVSPPPPRADSPYTIERPTPVWSLPNFLIRAPAFLGDTFP